MVMSIKVNGFLIKLTDLALTQVLTVEENTLELGETIYNMVKV